MLIGFFQDCRYTLRQLVKSPTFATTALLTLALGIAANVPMTEPANWQSGLQ